jgi:hypothetical protein
LPLPAVPIEEFGHRVDAAKDYGMHIVLNTTFYDPAAQIFSDFAELQKIRNWIYRCRN